MLTYIAVINNVIQHHKYIDDGQLLPGGSVYI